MGGGVFALVVAWCALVAEEELLGVTRGVGAAGNKDGEERLMRVSTGIGEEGKQEGRRAGIVVGVTLIEKHMLTI